MTNSIHHSEPVQIKSQEGWIRFMIAMIDADMQAMIRSGNLIENYDDYSEILFLQLDLQKGIDTGADSVLLDRTQQELFVKYAERMEKEIQAARSLVAPLTLALLPPLQYLSRQLTKLADLIHPTK